MYTGNFYNPYGFNQNVSYPNYSQTTQDNGGNGLVWVQGEVAAFTLKSSGVIILFNLSISLFNSLFLSSNSMYLCFKS